MINCHLGGHLVRIFILFGYKLVCSVRFQLHSNNLRKKKSLRYYFRITQFSLIIVYHLGRHLGYIEMLNDARVASLGFFKDKVCTTRINKEKKFKIKFQVPTKIRLNTAGLNACQHFLPTGIRIHLFFFYLHGVC